jgi:hypothetical protein
MDGGHPRRQLSDAAMRGRIGAYTKWARTEDRRVATAPARAAYMHRFELQVDPEGHLNSEERAKRAHYAMRAHMADLNRRRTLSRRKQARVSP